MRQQSGSNPPVRQLIGRKRELDALANRLNAPLAERGGIVLIAGEPGVGKSRLVGEASAMAQANGWRVFVGHAFDTDGMPPYLPFVDAIQDYVRECPVKALLVHLGAYAADVALLLPELRRRLPNLPATGEMDASSKRYRLFEGVVALLSAVSHESESGLVLCLEDLHWADDSTLLLLDYVSRHRGSAPILILATYRDTELETSDGLAATIEGMMRLVGAERLDLRRLPRDDVGLLLSSLGPSHPGSAMVDAFFKQTEGNPFFVREVFEYLAGESKLFDAEGNWRTHVQVGEAGVPQSIRLVIDRRLQRLSPDCRGLLTLASVIGRTFSYRLVRVLSELAEDALFSALEEAERAHLLTSEPTGDHTFAHELIRQTLLGAQALPRRKRLHQRIAAALEELFTPGIEPFLAEVAAHYQQAGSSADAVKVFEYAKRAGDHAAAVFAFTEAVRLYGIALDAAARSGEPAPLVHHERGRAYELLGKFDDALAEYQGALDAAVRPEDRSSRWQALLDLAMLWASRDYTLTGEYLERASLLAGEIGEPGQIAYTLTRYANWLGNVGRPLESVAPLQEALAIFETLADKPGIAATLDLLGVAHKVAGDLVKAHAHYVEANRLFEELGDTSSLASVLASFPTCAAIYNTDASVGAGTLLNLAAPGEKALRISREIGRRSAEAFAQCQLAFSLGTRGEYGAALDAARDASAISIEIGHTQWESASRCVLGAIFLDLLQFDAAREQLITAGRLSQETKAAFWTWAVAQLLARLDVAIDDSDAAAVVLGSLGRSGPPWSLMQRQAEAAWAEVALARGEASEALRILDALIESAANMGPRVVIPRLWHLKAQALTVLEQPAKANSLVEEALLACARDGTGNLPWRLHVDLVRIHSQSGDALALTHAAAEASRSIAEIASSIGEEPLTSNFRKSALLLLEGARLSRGARSRQVYAGGLSEREAEVLRLIVSGSSSREIGEALVLSRRTVERHIANIYNKTGTHGRAQVTAYALQRGLN